MKEECLAGYVCLSILHRPKAKALLCDGEAVREGVCVCRKEAVKRKVEKGIEGDRGGEAGMADSAPTLPPTTKKKCGYRDDVVPAAPRSSHLLVCRVPLDVQTHQSNKNARRKQNLEREGRQGGRVRDDNAKKKSKDDA